MTALGGVRWVEGQLTGGFHHSAFDPAHASSTIPPAGPTLQRIAREVRDELARRRSPAALWDGALLDLVLHRYSEAVSKLAEAAAQTPVDARLASDLAAAYLARASAGQDPADFVLALTTADRAVLADGRLREARFNRALALERLFLEPEAGEAWHDYLRLDPNSGWADEARAHLRRLSRPSGPELWRQQRGRLDRAAEAGEQAQVETLVARFPQPAREHVEEELLPAWAEARGRGDTAAADRILRTARGIATALAKHNGEHLPEDAVAAAERALAEPPASGRLAALIAGHKLYARACPLVNRHEIDAAWPLLVEAREALARGGSPLADWASLRLVICNFERSEMRQAVERLDQLRGSPRLERAPSLRGRIEWLTGLVRLAGADPSTALAAYERARRIFERNGEREHLASVETLLAENLRYLGEDRAAWAHRYKALSFLADFQNPRRLHATLEETAQTLVAQGQLRPALYFRDRAISAARHLGDPTSISHALLKRGEIRHQLHDEAGAARDIDEARRVSRKIASAGPRRRVEADILLAEGESLSTDAPARAIGALTQALGFYVQAGNHFPLVPIHLARGRAYLTAGRDRDAERDLAAGIGEFEEQRERVVGEQLRMSYFDQSTTIFDQMVRLQVVSRHRFDLALRYAERGRARGLLDRLGILPGRGGSGTVARSLTEELRRDLPARGALVELAVLEDRLIAWVLRRDAITSVTVPIGAADLARRVGRLRSALASGSSQEEIASASSQLYEKLVQPLSLQGDEPVVFVPDKSLHAVPFGALRNPLGGRYLIEERAVGVAPSATLYLRSLRRDRQLSQEAEPSALIVGNPAFDTAVFPELPPLPGAAAEARSIGELYPQHELLQGVGATKAAFLAAAGRHTIVHIAGHAIVNPEFPLLSLLALAPTLGDSGSLYAHELYGLRLPRTRLVLLSACGTGGGEPSGPEGVSSLARPFLAAGVPAVVASLWNVNDRATTRLLVAFHRRLRAGRDPLSALRSAQLELLRGPEASLRSPASWAAFEVFGGVHEE